MAQVPRSNDSVHWSITFEQRVAERCTEDLALEAEYDKRFGESDLLGASSVLHLQAMQEAALGNSAPARILAETAIYFADLCLSLNEDDSVQMPGFAINLARRTAKVNREEHIAIQDAAELGVQPATEKLNITSNNALRKARKTPAWIPTPQHFTLIRTYCYALKVSSDIAQDKFQGTDPTLTQRNWALWRATDIVDILAREEEVYLPKELKLQLAVFAFELISSYEPAEAEREVVLEAKDACYQGLIETTIERIGGTRAKRLAQEISYARHLVLDEQRELGLISWGSYGDIIDRWPKQ